MKKIYLLMILQVVLITLFAQTNEPANTQRPASFNPISDKQQYQEYTIKLLPVLPSSGNMSSYGFDILKDNKPEVHIFQNPLPFSPKGMHKKEDAYKIAQWMIKEYKNTGRWPIAIPAHIVYELKIETH